MSFGSRLRVAREHKGLTQIEVYKLTGINNKALSRYETDSTSPDPSTITMLAKLYEVSTDYLFGLINKFNYQQSPQMFSEEILEIVEKYQHAPENIKKATKAMLEITSQDDVKKENIR